MTNVIETLTKRGFIEAVTSEDVAAITKMPQKVYCGFDPTSDSLHLGNLVGIIGLRWFQKFGHSPYVILGGATGMVGDPSGKSHERNLLTESQLKKNLEGISKNFEDTLDYTVANKPVILNNYSWFKNFSFLDFLRDVGKSFRVGPMLAKEAVKSRLDSEEGISFTEFSYQILQAYDFLHLYKEHGVQFQIGGSDQWGNITQGKDLVRKETGDSVYGVTFPLLTRSDGKKFGKTEKGAIWLTKEKLSPYEFYQYLFSIPDADVIRMLKMLTFIDIEEIDDIGKGMKRSDYVANSAQERLAKEVTEFVHGKEGLGQALRATKAASPGKNTQLDVEQLELISSDVPNYEIDKNKLIGMQVIELLVLSGMQDSKSAGRRLIRGAGLSLNNEKVIKEDAVIEKKHIIGNKFVLLTIGRKQKMLIRIAEN